MNASDNPTIRKLSAWAGDFLEQRWAKAAQSVPKPEVLAEWKQKLNEAIEKLPGSAAREVDWLLALAKQHAASFTSPLDAEDSLQLSVINGSGILMHWQCRPMTPIHLPPQVDGFRANRNQPEALAGVQHAIHTHAMKLAGQDLLVANNLESALVAATLAQRGVKRWVVPRCHSISLPSGISLPDLLRNVGHHVVEVGSIDGWSPASIRNEIQDDPDGSVLITAQRIGERSTSTNLKQWKHEADGVRHLLHVATAVAPIALDEWVSPSPPTLRGLCEQTMLITSGNGLLAGPTSGLIFAAQSELNTIAQSPAWMWLQADLDSLVAMASTLRCWNEQPSPEGSMVSMLETKHANLRDRGNRLRNRLEQGGLEARVIEDGKPASLWAEGPWTLPSVQIQLRRESESVESLQRRLLSTRPIVLTDRDDDWLVLDLRWIPADLDVVLARQIIGQQPDELETSNEHAPPHGDTSADRTDNLSQSSTTG